MSLPTKIAVFLSHGTSLVDWKSLGLFDREVGYYRALSSRLGSMLLVTYDKPSDEFSRVQMELNGLSPCHNRWSLGYRLFGVTAPVLHAKVLRRCDVFRSEQIGGAWTAAIAARLYRKPLVVRCGYVKSIFAAQAGVHPLRQRMSLWLERRCVRAADLVFVTTESDRQYLAKTHGVPLDRFRIVPNPIDVDRFRPEPAVVKQQGRVVFVGRFNEQKNLGLLLDACRLADASLLLVGTGSLEKELRERASGGNVVFAGNVPNADLPRLLNTAEVFVLPSRYEGCPEGAAGGYGLRSGSCRNQRDRDAGRDRARRQRAAVRERSPEHGERNWRTASKSGVAMQTRRGRAAIHLYALLPERLDCQRSRGD